MLSARLNEAAAQGREITLLLRGAHRLVVTGASVEASSGGTVGGGGEARFDITGSISADGDPPAVGTVSVSSSDVASIFVKRDSEEG